MEGSGALMLVMARKTRFALVLKEGDDAETIDYDRLVVMAQALALFSDGDAAEREPVALRIAYPQAFSDWLYEYCRSQHDISDAWLALLSLGAEGKPNVCVLFDDYAAASHDQRVREQAHLLLPGQMLCEYAQLQDMTCDGIGNVAAKIRAQPALYNRTHKQGWWARLQRRRHPTPVIWFRIDLHK
jgi:hypothetical protein